MKISTEEMSKELLLKASLRDVCTLVDSKANVEDMQLLMEKVQKEYTGVVKDE